MWSMSGVGLGLERQDTSSLDMEQGAVEVVDFVGVGGALAGQKVLENFLRKIGSHLLCNGGKYFSISVGPAHA